MEKVSLTRDNTFNMAVIPFNLPYPRTPGESLPNRYSAL